MIIVSVTDHISTGQVNKIRFATSPKILIRYLQSERMRWHSRKPTWHEENTHRKKWPEPSVRPTPFSRNAVTLVTGHYRGRLRAALQGMRMSCLDVAEDSSPYGGTGSLPDVVADAALALETATETRASQEEGNDLLA